MIFRKPYAFFIKYFRVINLIMAVFMAVLIYHTLTVGRFLNEYINDAYNRNIERKETLEEQILMDKYPELYKGLNERRIEKKKVSSFSLGMRQRLGIAITLISNPKFIVLDEPMNGLDDKGVEDMRKVFMHLKEQGN